MSRERLIYGLLAFAILGLTIVGCPGDGSEIVNMPPPPPPSGPQPTLAWIQANVFTPDCTLCHVPGGIGLMPLDSEDVSFNNLVNVSAVENNSLFRVEPFDADDSYLVWKIEDDPRIVCCAMPLGFPLLEPEKIAMIRQWIDDGAER